MAINLLNPLCDMPWDIYLDYLADQGFDELREINIYNLISGYDCGFMYHNGFWIGTGGGETQFGDGGNFPIFGKSCGEGEPQKYNFSNEFRPYLNGAGRL